MYMPINQIPPKRKSFPVFIKIIAFILCFILSFEQTGFAQVAEQIDLSGSIGNFIHSFSASFSRLPQLRYISYNRLDQSFKIILNNGDVSKIQSVDLVDSAHKPLNFFYTGLAIANESFWVNLRPDSPEEIIDDYLAKTDLGKILLEADLELKKDLARATFPSTPQGKEYWDKIYSKIGEVYGYGLENIPISINTRIWITPGEVVVCQDENSAYIYKAGLNVSTEAAYLSKKQGYKGQDERARIINDYSSELMQELILPRISKEVNTGEKYSSLRQAYYSLILAQWFKRKFYGAGGLYPYLIDRNNLTGLTSPKGWSKYTYFKEYQKSFREKEYDLKVQVFDLFGRTIRTYSTGGVDFTGIFTGVSSANINVISSNSFAPPLTDQTNLLEVNNRLCTLQEPYLGRVSSVAVWQDAVSLPIIQPVSDEQQASYAIKTDNSSLIGNDLKKMNGQSWWSVLNDFILKALFSPVVSRPLSFIGNALSSVPKPVLQLMFVIPIVGTLLFLSYSTASAFAITADVANGSIKDLTFTFQPWGDSHHPANETLSGIGQIIGQSHGLEGKALTEFIYNQFIPDMKPILADQGISNVNIIRDGQQIKIPAKFLEGLTPDGVKGVLDYLHNLGWNPLDFNVNNIVDAGVVPGATTAQHHPDATATTTNIPVSPPTITSSLTAIPASTATPTPDATLAVPTHVPGSTATIIGSPTAVPISTVTSTPDATATTIHTPGPIATGSPTVAVTPAPGSTIVATSTHVPSSTATITSSPTVIPASTATPAPDATLAVPAPVSGSPATITGSPTTAPASTATPAPAQSQNSNDLFTQAMNWVNQNQTLLIVVGTVLAAVILFFIGRAIYHKIRNAQRFKQQKELSEMASQPQPAPAASVAQPAPVASVAQLQPVQVIQASNTTQKISEGQIDSIIESLKSSPKKYIQKLLNSKRINIRERIRFIADELGFDILNGKGVSLLVRNPETLCKNKEFLEGLVLPVNVTNLQSSKRSFVVRELQRIIKYSQWQQLTNEEKLAIVSYLFDVYGLRPSWITRDKDWNQLLERFNLQNTAINYSPRSIDFIQQYELARFKKLGNILRTKNRISKIKEIIEIMGLKVVELLGTTTTPEGLELYIVKSSGGGSESRSLPPIEAAPVDYATGSVPIGQEQVEDRVAQSRLKGLQSSQLSQAPPGDIADASGEIISRPAQETELLKKLEAIIDTDLTDLQIQAALITLMNSNLGEDNYERVRAILRHIHPDEFKKLRRVAQEDEPFASNQPLQERLASIALERPSELSVGLVRAKSKIHDWEEVLKKPYLTEEDLAAILGYCERIVALLPLRLTQETSDSIGSIYKTIKQVIFLIEKTTDRLISQNISRKTGYEESVKKLHVIGHYFSNYFAALCYLSAMNIPKGYIYNFGNNGNGHNGNGVGYHKVKYNIWQKLTAVPAMEKNAKKNLRALLPLINTEGNDFTVDEYYYNLRPTRIGSAESWLLRKPVSILVSFVLLLNSVANLIINGNFSPLSIIMSSIGFIAIPALHYIFALIGWIKTGSDIKNYHKRIDALEKSWKLYLPSIDSRQANQESANLLGPASIIPEPEESDNGPIEEDHAVEGTLVTRKDVEAIAEFADLLEIKPVEFPQINKELEIIFGSGRVNNLVVIIIPDGYMFTKDFRKINRPVRLGNMVFVGEDYFAKHSNDFSMILADMAHEQMAQWVAQNRPDLNPEAHSLAEDLAAVVKVTQDNGQNTLPDTLVNSASAMPQKYAPGGIDFRSIDFKAMSISSATEKISENTTDKLPSDSAEEELVQINRLIKAKIVPSSERLKDVLRKIPAINQERYIKQINNCLAGIFMLEEEYSQPCEASFIELLQKVVSN